MESGVMLINRVLVTIRKNSKQSESQSLELLNWKCYWSADVCDSRKEGNSVWSGRESVYFQGSLQHTTKKKMFFIWCIFSLVNVSVFLTPWVKFSVFWCFYLFFKVSMWLKHILQREICLKLLVWCFHALLRFHYVVLKKIKSQKVDICNKNDVIIQTQW